MTKDSPAASLVAKINDLQLEKRHDPCLEDKLLLESKEAILYLETLIDRLDQERMEAIKEMAKARQQKRKEEENYMTLMLWLSEFMCNFEQHQSEVTDCDPNEVDLRALNQTKLAAFFLNACASVRALGKCAGCYWEEEDDL